jgi:hypothetical protein
MPLIGDRSWGTLPGPPGRAGRSGRQAAGWPLRAPAWVLRGSRARAGSRDARTLRATVRTRIMVMAMKISPSVSAATLTWCAMPQLTSGAVN